MERPKKSSTDIAHTVAKAGLAAVPLVGGSAAELFSAVITPPIVKRRDEWIQSIADGLRVLEEKIEGFSLEALGTNDAFVTAVMQATQAAIRNHQREKLEALRNAVLNVASSRAPDEDVQLMFLNFIDTLTSWHLRLLHFFQNPQSYQEQKGITRSSLVAGAPSHALEETFPELKGQRNFNDQVAKDLFTRGLISSDSLHTMMTPSGVYAKRTTDVGDKFVRFISSPME